MMYSREIESVDAYKETLKDLLRNFASLPADDSPMDVCIYTESILSFNQLINLLEQQFWSEEPLPELLEQIKQFLFERWQRIHKTDATYCFQPASRANSACIILANVMSRCIECQHPYELLMPTIPHLIDALNDIIPPDKIRLWHFIIRENDTPISILRAIDILERDLIPIASHPQSAGDRLMLREEEFLSRHSSYANHCIDAIKSYAALLMQRHQDEQALMLSRVNVEESKQALIAYLFPASVEDISRMEKVGSTYDNTGRRFLAKAIIQQVTNRQEFISLLANVVPQHDWCTFIDLIIDKDFYQVMFGVKEEDPKLLLQKADDKLGILLNVKSKPLAQKDLEAILAHFPALPQKKMAVLAYLFCLLNGYERLRRHGEDNYSRLGWWASAPTKQEKLEACAAVEEILVTTSEVNHLIVDIETLSQHQKALQDGRLAVFGMVVRDIVERIIGLERSTSSTRYSKSSLSARLSE